MARVSHKFKSVVHNLEEIYKANCYPAFRLPEKVTEFKVRLLPTEIA